MVSSPKEFEWNIWPQLTTVQVGNTSTDGTSLHKLNTHSCMQMASNTPILCLAQTLENANTANPDLGYHNKSI